MEAGLTARNMVKGNLSIKKEKFYKKDNGSKVTL